MPRVSWAELPSQIQSWAAGVLGSAVTGAVTQEGGFSPGAASRLELADGRRAFIKAVSVQANPVSPGLHRQEAAVTAALPAGVNAPRLLGQYDDGEWVALLLSDVAGRSPAQPWTRPNWLRCWTRWPGMHERCTPSPVAALPTVAEYHASSLHGWRDLAAGEPSPAQLDDWSRRNLDRLAGLEAQWPAAAAGDTLLHNDVRADNMLITGAEVIFVDWPARVYRRGLVRRGRVRAECDHAGRTRPGLAAGPDPVGGQRRSRRGHRCGGGGGRLLHPAGAAARPGRGIPRRAALPGRPGPAARAWLRQRTGWN